MKLGNRPATGIDKPPATKVSDLIIVGSET